MQLVSLHNTKVRLRLVLIALETPITTLEKAPEEPERVATHQEGPGQVRQHRHGAAGRLSVIVPQTWGRCRIVQRYYQTMM